VGLHRVRCGNDLFAPPIIPQRRPVRRVDCGFYGSAARVYRAIRQPRRISVI
jgi:hypothetical protein